MKDIFWNKHRKFSIRKLKIGIASVTVGLVFVNSVIGMNHVEAALSVEDSNYINETAVNNGALVEYIRQALATISKAANSTVLPSSIQNLKEKVQALSTKKEVDYTESAWQEFQGKLTTAKSVLAEAEKAYNKAVTINPNAQSYETTINELITSYPEYNTVVIKVREGESGETAENRHLTNLRRINGVLSAKYSELSETAQSLKNVLPSFGEDLATQQLKIIESAENVLEVNKKTKTLAETEHADLMAGLFENHKVTLSDLSALRGTITSADQSKITAFLESHNPSVGETAVFQTYVGALQYQFNNNGTVTITYTDDGSSDTVPLSIFAKGGAAQTESPVATYSVTYNYVSGTPDKSLPSNITAPAAVSDKHTGDVVASPSGQTDVEDTANQGTWHFKGWDKASVTIGTANETVIGTWNFIPTPPVASYSVTYNYVSGTPDKSLPSSTLPTTIGWIKEDNRWWYKHADGSYTANDWEQIKGIWYHFDQSGWMQTGWIQDKGTWYYLNKSGAMAIGWIQENGRWYYLNNSGAMKTGWVKDNDTWYYLDNSGAMKTGWFKVSGKWYYAYSSGALAVDTTVDGYTVNANGEWV